MDRSTRNLRHRGLAAALAVATLGTGPLRDASAPAPRERPGWEEKVESRLLLSRADGERDLLVELADRADLSGAWSLPTRAEKRRFVIERLQETARLSQAPLTAWLRARGIPHRAFWITNTIRLHGSLDVLEALARRPEVARIEENRSQRRRPRIPDAPAAGSRTPTSATAAAANWQHAGREARVIEMSKSGAAS